MPSRNRTDQGIFETLQAAEAVAQRLRALIRSLGQQPITTQFYTRIRVKSYDSAVKKVYAKRRTTRNELYSFFDITDLVGFRIVTLYDDDIEKAVDYIFALLEASRRSPHPIFTPFRTLIPAGSTADKLTRWDFVREILFFRRMQRGKKADIYGQVRTRLRLQLRKQVTDDKLLKHHMAKLKIREPENEDYSSIHILLNATETIRSEPVEIPIEVQIRTAAEDIWGEINHQLLYKAKDLYVWTPSLANIVREMQDDSSSIKKSLEELRAPVTRFWRHSKAAEDEIAKFKEPTRTSYHRSLIVTLFYAMSGEYFENVNPLLQQYDTALVGLTHADEPRQAADVLRHCLDLMTQVKAGFGDELKRLPASAARAEQGTKDRNAYILLKQRQHLCGLEISRLRSLAVFRFRYSLESNQPRPIEEDRYSTRVHKVFNELCELRNSWDFIIRPVAMLSFWKSVIAKQFSPQLALYHLRIAAEELEQDTSLPEWSIYRILIPRQLAAELYEDAKRLVRLNGRRTTREVWWRSQLAVDVRIILGRAFELSLQAHNRHTKKDKKKAGDLVFGFERDESVRDADTIANIASLYVILYDSPDYERLGITPAFLVERIEEVQKFLRASPAARGTDPASIEKKLKKLDKLLIVVRKDLN